MYYNEFGKSPLCITWEVVVWENPFWEDNLWEIVLWENVTWEKAALGRCHFITRNIDLTLVILHLGIVYTSLQC